MNTRFKMILFAVVVCLALMMVICGGCDAQEDNQAAESLNVEESSEEELMGAEDNEDVEEQTSSVESLVPEMSEPAEDFVEDFGESQNVEVDKIESTTELEDVVESKETKRPEEIIESEVSEEPSDDTSEEEQEEDSEVVPEEEITTVNLGRFRLTAYCNCSKCCGKWAGGATASGVMPVANHTIAVDTGVIPFGTEVIINGATYVAEDTGSAIYGNRIDIYFNTHQEAMSFGVQYADVYKIVS